jgi:hypothetical protein
MSLPHSTLSVQIPPGLEPDMREMSLLDGQEITLHRDQAGPGRVSTRLSYKSGILSNDGIPYSRSIWLSDGGAFPALNRNERSPARNARYLKSVKLRLIAQSEESRQSSNCSQSDINGDGNISLTYKGHGYENYRVLGSIHAEIVSATKLQRDSESALTKFEGAAWKDIRLQLGQTIYVKDNDYVNWKRQKDEEYRKMQEMVDTLVDD